MRCKLTAQTLLVNEWWTVTDLGLQAVLVQYQGNEKSRYLYISECIGVGFWRNPKFLFIYCTGHPRCIKPRRRGSADLCRWGAYRSESQVDVNIHIRIYHSHATSSYSAAKPRYRIIAVLKYSHAPIIDSFCMCSILIWDRRIVFSYLTRV